MIDWLPRLVARIPVGIRVKLLVSILGIVMLFVALGLVGLLILRGLDQRATELVGLQQQIAAYRQLQHNTTEQLYALTSALLAPDSRRLDATLRQMNQFTYDFDRAQFVAGSDAALLEQVKQDYTKLIDVGSRIVGLIRGGAIQDAQRVRLSEAVPLSDRLRRQTYALINRTEAQMVSSVETSNRYYELSQTVLIGVALVSILLALIVNYAMSKSLTAPVHQMYERFDAIARGNFTDRLNVANRDELGDLARELNHMSGELDRLYRELEEASQHKSQFLASMSHELRTPLNAILGFNEMILDGIYGEISQDVRAPLENMQESGKHLLRLINNVLDLAKIEAGRMELALADYVVQDLVEGVRSALSPLAEAKGLEFRASVPAGLPLARGDAGRLTQCLMNLVGNALKFTKQGHVAISVEPKGESLVFRVADTGIGIPPEKMDSLFTEFKQTDATVASEYGGSGLGLAIARQFIEMHGGRIRVESEPGKGSTFIFEIPLRAGQ